jgi:urate oxidase
MGIVLGDNRYGKAEVRLVRVDRDGELHRLTDLTVSVALSGDLDAVHLSGDNAHVPGGPAPHSFVRTGDATRTATIGYDGGAVEVVSGLTGLTVLNSTGSEFWGFAKDRYTTLPETTDRILATAVDARWRHADDGGDWAGSYAAVRRLLLEAFADTYSYSLQQTLYAMGERVLAGRPEVAEIRLALPNKHHFAVDLAPFGVTGDGVYHAADRPYGLIEGTIARDDRPAATGLAW